MPRRATGSRRRVGGALAWLTALALVGALGVYADPALVPQAVDLARAAFGPELVGQVESLVFQTQDEVRQVQYRATGAHPTLQWTQPAEIVPAAPGAATHDQAMPTAASTSPAQPAMPGASAALWSPYLTTASGQPLLERALVAPDTTRPYAEAVLVRIDLHNTELHLVAGTQEPKSPIHTTRTGLIPRRDQAHLLAAFNGGFKAISGGFGMAVDGKTLLPPKNGLATLGFYRDGHVRLGNWGSDMQATPDLIAFRQNCPLLIDHGALSPLTDNDTSALWGKTVGNRVATWRSGLGLSADGRYLVYAAGDGLTIASLAQALIAGGADRAMQLDINSFWTRFVIYAHDAHEHVVAQKLIDSMAGDAHQFLIPDTRDFFYVTERACLASAAAKTTTSRQQPCGNHVDQPPSASE